LKKEVTQGNRSKKQSIAKAEKPNSKRQRRANCLLYCDKPSVFEKVHANVVILNPLAKKSTRKPKGKELDFKLYHYPGICFSLCALKLARESL
jgi:hypothetical protein